MKNLLAIMLALTVAACTVTSSPCHTRGCVPAGMTESQGSPSESGASEAAQ